MILAVISLSRLSPYFSRSSSTTTAPGLASVTPVKKQTSNEELRRVDPTAPVRRLLHSERYFRMWREKWVGPINMDRVGFIVSGMDTYALVATVLLQVILGLYGSTSDPGADAPRWKTILYDTQMVLLTIATLASCFTMVTFLLNKIYAVTALGMQKDVAYDLFGLVTDRYRYASFWSLNLAMITFMISYCLNVIELARGYKRRIATAAVTLIGMAIMIVQWFTMIGLASKYIYNL